MKWTDWIAAIFIITLVILAIWWTIQNSERYVFLEQDFPDPTNRMCRCRPLPFDGFDCKTLDLKRVCCKDFDLEGRRCYCCTSDDPGCTKIACSVPY